MNRPMQVYNEKKYQDLVPSPCYVLEQKILEENLHILEQVQQQSGAKILLALKAFAMHSTFDSVSKFLCGAAASGIHEARLAREELNLEVHSFSPAIKDHEFDDLLTYSDHIIFNSLSQWEKFRKKATQYPEKQFGLRINPEYSEAKVPLYDPCASGSRLGITNENISGQDLTGISGLHFHTLCEQGFEPLSRTVAAFEKKFNRYLTAMKWVNFGGGHHITKPDYDRKGLIQLLISFQKKYDLQVYLEPGEAISYHTGVLIGEVVDIIWNKINIAILDISATTHMPDVLEMPYRPDIIGAFPTKTHSHNYRLAGPSCLAGDIIGDYSFKKPLKIGQRLAFTDMIHYTMVKNNTFNGVPLPAIAIWGKDEQLSIVKQFGYDDFKQRLS